MTVFCPPAFGVIHGHRRMDRGARRNIEDTARRRSLLGNAPDHQFALLQSPLPLGANCRHSQRAGRPASFNQVELKLPARAFAFVHAAVVAIDHVFEHIAELPLALHRVPAAKSSPRNAFQERPEDSARFRADRRRPERARHLRQRALRHDRAGIHTDGNERDFKRLSI